MMRMLSACAAMVIVVGLWMGFSRPAAAANFERIGSPCRTCNSELPCLPPGAWHAFPWMTPTFPQVCQPLFASGVALHLVADEPITVVRLQPIPTGKPEEPRPARLISEKPPRPRRPRIDIDEPPPGDMPGGELSKLHLVLLIDNEAAEAGKAHAAGAELMQQLLKAGIRAERINPPVQLNSADLNLDAIGRKLQDVPVKPDDTLVVYYAGAAEFADGATGVTLTPGGNKFAREELRKLAVAKGARLTVLLSDPASKPVLPDGAKKPETPDPGPAGLEKLFFGFQGIVDIHGCSAGEFASARGEHGGCFTQAFVREFGRPTGSWADMVETVKFQTNTFFKSYRLEVLKADDLKPADKASYRNQESQIPTPMTPVDNLKPAGPAGGGGTPPKQGNATLEENKPARIYLKVPDKAAVFIDGVPTQQTGSERGFETPPLSPGMSYDYDFRVELNGWAGVYRLNVRGGATVMAELQVPAAIAAK